MKPYRILFGASEVYPLIKTGGLADVAGALPHALKKLGHDVHIVLPAYPDVLARLKHPPVLRVEMHVQSHVIGIRQTTLPGTRVPVWLIECPELYGRAGNPYHDQYGEPWHDNALRFAVFSQVITAMAMNRCGLDWQPEIVHCNDWQTGLVPALLAQEAQRPATVFTIHNLAYQGVFDRGTFELLQLDEYFWHYERLEYHNYFSFLKGGLIYADRINTVSPTYAREIQTTEFGYGLQGVLQHRADRLSGIINGIDPEVWNPGTDSYLPHKYNRQHLPGKALNKQALQQQFQLTQDTQTLLLGLVSRLAQQKGIDMLLTILPDLMQRPVQLAIVGSGDKTYEQDLRDAASLYPGKIGVHIGYAEALAHLIEAGADVFLMPSRFEPCGLNQMYSQRYGTLPIVTPVGGLFDSVTDTTAETIAQGTASGFVMPEISETALLQTIDRAITAYAEQESWKALMRSAMKLDHSWAHSAQEYAQLYAQALLDNPPAPGAA
ncbi:MAG: glycogen synthase GlgA [Gammaproteobacteria bacterium]|nr:glycogen synthase GlgA [Gammaproteobacteria bacterium]